MMICAAIAEPPKRQLANWIRSMPVTTAQARFRSQLDTQTKVAVKLPPAEWQSSSP
ncbi:hypothetical protein BCR44DRAFT_43151 [Catenaria anguillulae PL171]|uniref:Uncharacterized protein n=1 Tax=Catenaria anguillulae PL171 TaxID=765915 RepID=A0A1Y2H844_9FUNG|nr:hypothetical protein BCR44DRAFT_43151 [Catenaria anguillulae PL171]